MFVKFNKLTARNIMSYGNAVTELDFKSGLNLVNATNGKGKSSFFLDVLSFALFGQPYRKIKISELINRTNEKNLVTTIEFEIGNDIYKIIRGLAPNILEITKNGDKSKTLSSKKLDQAEIDKIIGIDYVLFKQIISLAIGFNKPFLDMSAQGKRDIIESIFGIKIFGDMNRILKKKISANKNQLELSTRTISLLKMNINGIRKQIEDTKKAIETFESDKQKEIYDIKKEIEKYIETINFLELENIKFTSELVEIDTLEHDQKLEEKFACDESISNCIFNIEDLNKKIDFLENQNICDHCNQVIDETHKKEHLIKYKKTLKDHIDNKKFYIDNRDALIQYCNNYELHKTNNSEINNKIYRIKNEIQNNNDSIQKLEEDIKKIKNRTLNLDLVSMSDELDKRSSEYKKAHKEYKEQAKIAKINKIISDILSEEGVKAFFFKKLIPLLNAKINEILNRFDLPLEINFDETITEEIKNYSAGNHVVNYHSLSEGEKKRIDTAILLAFINVTKLINNWKTNILIMDEVLDSSVDEEGLTLMLNCLKGYINSSEDDMAVYLISHRMLDEVYFDGMYKINKNSGFSTIECLK